MITEIELYLQEAEPDFIRGFALFCKYSRSEPLKRWISRRKDMAKLLYELCKLSKLDMPYPPPSRPDTASHQPKQDEAQSSAAAEAAAEPAKTAVFRTYDERKTRRADLPEEYKAVYDSITSDYKLRRAQHEKMKLASTDADRARFRQMILETDERIASGWRQIDAYLAFAAEAAQKADGFNEGNCRTYISKALAREKNSPIQVNTVKARVRALQDHGCVIEQKTLDALKAKGLL